MEGFRDHIFFINDKFNTNDFPERFGNEIYISNVTNAFYYQYTSPFSIKYVHRGIELYRVERDTLTIKDDQALIINHNQNVTAFRDAEHEANEGMSIFLDPALIAEVMMCAKPGGNIPHYRQSTGNPAPLFHNQKIIGDDTFLRYLSHLYMRRIRDKNLEAADYYDIIEHLLQFQFQILDRTEKIDKAKPSTRQEIYKRIKIAHDYLHDAHNATFSLDAVARECSLSKYFLIRCFRTIYQTTPQRYHQNIRMQKAKDLLLRKDSVTEVADMLGYNDLSSFSRDFKRIVRMSPVEYKNAQESNRKTFQITK